MLNRGAPPLDASLGTTAKSSSAPLTAEQGLGRPAAMPDEWLSGCEKSRSPGFALQVMESGVLPEIASQSCLQGLLMASGKRLCPPLLSPRSGGGRGGQGAPWHPLPNLLTPFGQAQTKKPRNIMHLRGFKGARKCGEYCAGSLAPVWLTVYPVDGIGVTFNDCHATRAHPLLESLLVALGAALPAIFGVKPERG